MNTDKPKIGPQVKAFMQAKGWSLEKLAAESNQTPAKLGAIIEANEGATMAQCVRIARALGVDRAALLPLPVGALEGLPQYREFTEAIHDYFNAYGSADTADMLIVFKASIGRNVAERKQGVRRRSGPHSAFG